jgi:hypothetical protein
MFPKKPQTQPQLPSESQPAPNPGANIPAENPIMDKVTQFSLSELFNYPSDLSNDGTDPDDSDDETQEAGGGFDHEASSPKTGISHLQSDPPLKWWKLEVSFCNQRALAKAEHKVALEKAFADIKKHLKSAKKKFEGGLKGLQARWAATIQSHLMLVVKNGHNFIPPSIQAAKTHGFAAHWGGVVSRLACMRVGSCKMVSEFLRKCAIQQTMPNIQTSQKV